MSGAFRATSQSAWGRGDHAQASNGKKKPINKKGKKKGGKYREGRNKYSVIRRQIEERPEKTDSPAKFDFGEWERGEKSCKKET